MSPLRIASVMVVLLAAACQNKSDTVGKTSLTRAVMDTTPCPNAITSIVDRRCRNAQVCATKLHDAAFQPSACQKNLRSHLELDLDRSTSCPEDVDSKALRACLDALDHDYCSRAMASVDQVVACSHIELCGRAFPAPLQ